MNAEDVLTSVTAITGDPMALDRCATEVDKFIAIYKLIQHVLTPKDYAKHYLLLRDYLVNHPTIRGMDE